MEKTLNILEHDIEDRMLASAYENFINTVESIEKNDGNNHFEIENQM